MIHRPPGIEIFSILKMRLIELCNAAFFHSIAPLGLIKVSRFARIERGQRREKNDGTYQCYLCKGNCFSLKVLNRNNEPLLNGCWRKCNRVGCIKIFILFLKV